MDLARRMGRRNRYPVSGNRARDSRRVRIRSLGQEPVGLPRSHQARSPGDAAQVYKLFFLCERTGGEPRPSIETSEVGFFPVNSLPDLSMARVTPAQIKRLYDKVARGDLITDFD